MTIQVDYTGWEVGKDYPEWMNEVSLATISKGYLLPDETPKLAFKRVANSFVFLRNTETGALLPC